MRDHRLRAGPEPQLLRGPAALAHHLALTYARNGGIPEDTLVLLLLDHANRVLGAGRVLRTRSDVGPFDLAQLIISVLRPLRSDPRAAGGRKVVAIRHRGCPTVPAGALESDAWLWSALVGAGSRLGLEAVDAVTITGGSAHCHQGLLGP